MQFHQWAKSVRPVVPGSLHGPSYARELISMFTTVNEGEWNTRNDPTSTASISDDVLTSLMSRDAGFSKGLANAIYSRLNIDNLICLIEDLDEPAQNLIRLNFESFGVRIRLTHVAEDACLILLDILERLAKIKKPDLQARIRIRQLAAKARYREELLVLSDGCLQCGKTLNIESHDKSKASYMIVLLDEDIEEPLRDDFAVLCTEHGEKYQLAHTKKEEQQLRANLARLLAKHRLADNVVPLGLEKEISLLLDAVSNIPYEQRIPDPKFKAVDLEQKIHDADLLSQATDAVSVYKPFIVNQLKSKEAREQLKFTRLCNQVQGAWLTFESSGLDQPGQFRQLCDWMNNHTGSGIYVCGILISYFIHICEVFRPDVDVETDYAIA